MKKTVVIDTNTNQEEFNSKTNLALHKICSIPLIEHMIIELKDEATGIFVAGDEQVENYLKAREDVTFINDVSNAPKESVYIPVSMPLVWNDEQIVCRTREDFCLISRMIQNRIIKKLMEQGVNIISPESTYISPFAVIGRDSVIYPDVHIEGRTQIGENTTIYSGTTIDSSEIGDNVTVRSSVILESCVGDNTLVGPFAYIRPHCSVGNSVRVGDFVELKNSQIGNGTKISHLTYVGDSLVGERVNFGCGTVTVNYDGINKTKTIIGDDVFIGCNTNLIAPVTVGNNSFIAAGSTITHEVPEEGFAIARSRQINKENWVKPKDRK